MKVRIEILLAGTIGALFCAIPRTFGDTWLSPKTEYYCSANKQYCLEVVPKKLESQLKYFEDKAAGRDEAGSSRHDKNNSCKGTLLRMHTPKPAEEVWSTHLVNEVAPVDVLVSNDGEYVVTFDNWHRVGYGDDVVVIYGPGGKLTREFSLEDLLGEDADRVVHTVSSRRWAGNNPGHYLDETKGVLILQAIVVDTVRFGNIYATKKDSPPQTREIRISLVDGQILPSPRE